MSLNFTSKSKYSSVSKLEKENFFQIYNYFNLGDFTIVIGVFLFQILFEVIENDTWMSFNIFLMLISFIFCTILFKSISDNFHNRYVDLYLVDSNSEWSNTDKKSIQLFMKIGKFSKICLRISMTIFLISFVISLIVEDEFAMYIIIQVFEYDYFIIGYFILYPNLLRFTNIVTGEYIISDRLGLIDYLRTNVDMLQKAEEGVVELNLWLFEDKYIKFGNLSNYQIKKSIIKEKENQLLFLINIIRVSSVEYCRKIIIKWFQNQINYLDNLEDQLFMEEFENFQFYEIISKLDLKAFHEGFEDITHVYSNVWSKLKESINAIGVINTGFFAIVGIITGFKQFM